MVVLLSVETCAAVEVVGWLAAVDLWIRSKTERGRFERRCMLEWNLKTTLTDGLTPHYSSD